MVCIETRLSICAAYAAACTARLNCRAPSESFGSSPGNSQPPSSILPWRRATRHQTQAFKQDRREHAIAVFAALALLDAQGHALAINVSDLQGRHFADAQSGALGDRERGLVLEVSGRGEQARHLFTAQDHRQLVWHTHRLHLGDQVAPRSTVMSKKNVKPLIAALGEIGEMP